MAQDSRPLLIATIGCPGSGKSYLSALLAADLRAAHLRSDDFRFWLFEEPTFSSEEHAAVFGLMDNIAEKLLSTGVSVVYDANFNFKRHRDAARRLAERYGAQFVLLYVDTPLEVAIERAANRATHQLTRETVEQMSAEIESFHDEGAIHVDGTLSYEDQRDELLARIDRG